MFPGALVAGVAAGFIGYVLCGRCAMAEWHADEAVFSPRPRTEDHRARPTSAPMAVARVRLLSSVASPRAASRREHRAPASSPSPKL
jgi:hypothetical protein